MAPQASEANEPKGDIERQLRQTVQAGVLEIARNLEKIHDSSNTAGLMGWGTQEFRTIRC